MDKALIAYKFSKSLKSYDQEAKAQKQIVKQLVNLFAMHGVSDFETILEFGTGTGLLTKEIHNRYNFKHLYLNDLSEEFEKFTLSRFTEKEQEKISFIRGDIEQVSIPKKQNLIISSSTEQWIENKSSFYNKIYDSLEDGGYFVFSSFGPDNLKQLREATGISLEYYTLSETNDLLADKFEILHVEEDRISLSFKSAIEILTHIKKTGVNAISKQNWTKKSVMQLISKIEDVCKKGDAYEITYHPMYFILKKRL